MIAVRLKTVEDPLLSKKTGRVKTFRIRKAILNYLDDLEDIYAVVKHILRPGKKTYSSEEVKHALGL